MTFRSQLDNVEFTYLYRDAGNYKKWGGIVFSNPDGLTSSSIENELREALRPDGLFVAGQVKVPEVFHYLDERCSFDDHCYHEFARIRPTAKEANDIHRRSIKDFLAEIGEHAEERWRTFDPCDRQNSLA